MELSAALEALARILNEERQRPTSDYKDNLRDIRETPGEHPLLKMAAIANRFPRADRTRDPKQIVAHQVWERPETYSFKGTNYDLLQRLFARLTPTVREKCVATLLEYVRGGGNTCRCLGHHYPQFDWEVSDTPLIAEFLIRLGYLESLLEAAGSAPFPTNGLVLLLLQISEMVVLNFNVLSEAELKLVPKALAPLREMADLQTYKFRGHRGKMVPNPKYRPGREAEANAIVKCIDAIKAECDQALFFYLRGALQQDRNPEVESDRIKVIEFLDTLGFPPNLKQALEEAEHQYQDDATPFELKSCLGHLRSVLEFTHRDAAKVVAQAAGDTVPPDWNASADLLRRKDVVTSQQEKFARSLYTLLSDEGVHPIVAKQEFARLLRNMVIEYTLLFLTILNNKGITIA